MAKTEIKKQKVEVIKQVKLTANQRIEIIRMSTEGGRARNIDSGVRYDLLALGLIEERDRYTNVEKIAVHREIAEMWKKASALVKAKDDPGALSNLSHSMLSKQYDLKSKAYWLTDAANEYLVKGTVTITR